MKIGLTKFLAKSPENYIYYVGDLYVSFEIQIKLFPIHFILTLNDTLAEFRSIVMNNKAFGNLFCNSQKSFTPLRDLPTRIIEAIDHSSNSTMAFAFTKNPRRKFFCKCHCWVWRMIDSLYYSSRKVPGRCENSFVTWSRGMSHMSAIFNFDFSM